jgi:hypothetical protein
MLQNTQSHRRRHTRYLLPSVFDSLKSTIQDLLHGRVAPGDRRSVIAGMKQALAAARLGVEDLRGGVEDTRRKLSAERDQIATVRRRKALAQDINDAETVAVASKYESQHAERIGVLERKLEAQEAEAALAERELGEMMSQMKAANAGVGSGLPPSGPPDEELGLHDDARLHTELDALARQRARSEASAAADEKLAELKKRMGH